MLLWNKIISVNCAEIISKQRQIKNAIICNQAPHELLMAAMSKIYPIKRIVIHQFQYNANTPEPISQRFIQAYMNGEIDKAYVTRSTEYRALSHDDAVYEAVHKQKEQKGGSPYYVFGEKDGEKYYKIIIGSYIISVSFDEKYERESIAELNQVEQYEKYFKYSILDDVRRASFDYLHQKILSEQAVLSRFFTESANIDGLPETNVEQLVRGNAQLLQEYFGMNRVEYEFIGDAQEVFALPQPKLDFSYILSDPNCSESKERCDNASKCIEHTFLWDEKRQVGYRIKLHYSPDRDEYVDRAMHLEWFIKNIGFDLKNAYEEAQEKKRQQQEREHYQRIINLLEKRNDVQGLKEQVIKDIHAYFTDNDSAVPVRLTFESKNKLINAFSDETTAEESENIVTLIENSVCTVKLHIPAAYTSDYSRLQDWFNAYLGILKISLEMLLQQYEPLTGLWTSANFMQTIEKEMAFVKKNPQAHLVVGWLDCFKFKMFNEIFSHQFADEELKAIAVELQALFPDLATRLHGDEFLVGFKYFVDDGKLTNKKRQMFEQHGYVEKSSFDERVARFKVFAAGIPQKVFFSEGARRLRVTRTISDFSLGQLIEHFFTNDEKTGAVVSRNHSRDPQDDYSRIISDKDRKIEALVTKVQQALDAGEIKFGDRSLREYAWENNTIGSFIEVLPQLSHGDFVDYNSSNLPEYLADMIVQAEEDWAKHKKQ